jgi:diguanylate cyclase (GGDEF)-like protein/PAS domain S-box-containing protein
MLLWMLLKRSIKSRVILAMLSIFILSMWLILLFASTVVREDTQRLLSEQQFASASLIAGEVNDGLAERISILESAAGKISPLMLRTPSVVQAYLDARTGIVVHFNAGVYVTGVDGTALASAPADTHKRIGVNYRDRDHVASALQQGKAKVGEVVVGKVLNSPVFSIGVPILADHGKVIGALVGVIDLSAANFLDQFTSINFGSGGGYTVLVAPKQRLFITSSDKRRVMTALSQPGAQPLVDRFVAGYDGSGILTNVFGVSALVSAKSVPVAGWYAAVGLPTDEAFAPIRAMEHRMLVAVMALSVLAGGLIWWVLRREFSPLEKVAQDLAAQRASNLPPRPLTVRNDDEIGSLIGGFNALLVVLRQREIELRRTANVFTHTREGIVITDKQGTILDVNEAFSRITGYPRHDVLGQNPRILGSGRQSREFYTGMWRELLASGYWTGEIWNRRKNGEIYPENLTISAVIDEQGACLQYVGLFSDIGARKQLEVQVQHQAFHDTLTQLANRRLLNDRLQQCMVTGKRNGLWSAVLFVDLDSFKQLNDAHGHGVGDLLLVEVARRLKACLRELDTVARFGGDEFVVLLGHLDADKTTALELARNVAEKMRISLAAPYPLRAQEDDSAPGPVVGHQCSASIGVVVFCGDTPSAAEVLKRADAAMYQAKAAGRNAIRFSETEA